jgi:hypothetical protein
MAILQIEAKLNTSLDTILRYQAALKRDLYRAIAALRAIQGQGRRRKTVKEKTNFTNGLLVRHDVRLRSREVGRTRCARQ